MATGCNAQVILTKITLRIPDVFMVLSSGQSRCEKWSRWVDKRRASIYRLPSCQPIDQGPKNWESACTGYCYLYPKMYWHPSPSPVNVTLLNANIMRKIQQEIDYWLIYCLRILFTSSSAIAERPRDARVTLFDSQNCEMEFLSHPVGVLRGNVDASRVRRWKKRGRLPIGANWTL